MAKLPLYKVKLLRADGSEEIIGPFASHISAEYEAEQAVDFQTVVDAIVVGDVDSVVDRMMVEYGVYAKAYLDTM